MATSSLWRRDDGEELPAVTVPSAPATSQIHVDPAVRLAVKACHRKIAERLRANQPRHVH